MFYFPGALRLFSSPLRLFQRSQITQRSFLGWNGEMLKSFTNIRDSIFHSQDSQHLHHRVQHLTSPSTKPSTIQSRKSHMWVNILLSSVFSTVVECHFWNYFQMVMNQDYFSFKGFCTMLNFSHDYPENVPNEFLSRSAIITDAAHLLMSIVLQKNTYLQSTVHSLENTTEVFGLYVKHPLHLCADDTKTSITWFKSQSFFLELSDNCQ